MREVPDAFWGVVSFLFGAVIGSFLNVVIWRLPRGMSLAHPGSHCPHCNHALRAFENVPLVSFLALGARCASCRQPISWRYFLVELFTAATFVAMFLRYGPTVETVAYCLFASALVAAFFIDLELFIIPDELNVFALGVGIAYDVWAASVGSPGHALVAGWLPRSILGAALCAAVFVGIQVLGAALFHKEAMGDGDVKLARAIGAMLPLGAALVSFFFAICAGAIIGMAVLLVRYVVYGREEPRVPEGEGTEGIESDSATPLRSILSFGLRYITFADLAIALGAKAGIPAARRIVGPATEVSADDDFVPGPTHIPFGPYMVLGALVSVFVGERFIAWYLAWAHLAPGG